MFCGFACLELFFAHVRVQRSTLNVQRALSSVRDPYASLALHARSWLSSSMNALMMIGPTVPALPLHILFPRASCAYKNYLHMEIPL